MTRVEFLTAMNAWFSVTKHDRTTWDAALAVVTLPDEGEVTAFCDPLSDVLARTDRHLLWFDIGKSDLLWRLLYGREPLRTEKCPIHQGQWSGCHPEPCPHGCDYTGWLRVRP